MKGKAFYWIGTAVFLTIQILQAVPGSTAPGHSHLGLPLPGLKTPLVFEANQGQADSRYPFFARGNQYTVFLSPDETVLAFQKSDGSSTHLPSSASLRLSLEGANPPLHLEGQNPLAVRTHYFRGQDPGQWKIGIPTYTSVLCPQVYPGIDLVYYGNQGQLEYDFVVAPGADPSSVQFRIQGMQKVGLDSQGNLLLTTPIGTFLHHRPVAYQEMGGLRKIVSASYQIEESVPLSSGAIVKFALGAYDPQVPLVIDPVLSFSTLFGGKGDDQAYGISLDAEGNVYVAGQTSSPDFPKTADTSPDSPGGYDAFVTKFKAKTYEVVYSAYFGGSANDRAFHVAVDGKGQALVSGVTYSTNFPVFNASQPKFGGGERDGFVAKLLADGSGFVYATYWGGNSHDDATCIATDINGNAYVAGDTASTNFPIVRPLQDQNRGGFDAVVGKFSSEGKLIFSSYLGGSGPYDSTISIAVDPQGNAYITGYTSSPDFPKVNPLQASYRGGYEAFISKLNPEKSQLILSTLFGGSADDVGRGIVVDLAGNIYVSGDTFSTNFPIRNPIQRANAGKRDIFVTKLDANGSNLIYSTYLGGSGEELAGITLDPNNNVCLVGVTSSTNFPLANELQSSFGGGSWDAFVSKLNSAGSELLFSSYLGGNGNDQGSPIATDKAGNIFIAGATTSTNFPLKNASQPIHKGGPYDAFLLILAESGEPGALVQLKEGQTDHSQQEKLAQEKLAQEKLAQEKLAQEKLAQEKLAQEKLAQEKLAQEKLAQEETKPIASDSKPSTDPTPKTEIPEVSTQETVDRKKSLLGSNLILNGDAELGSASVSSYGKVEIPGWTNIQGVIVLRYGTPGGFPGLKSPGPAERGSNFFVGGPDSAVSTMEQTVDVSSLSEAISKGQVYGQLSGYLGGAGGQRDVAMLRIVFLDHSNGIIREATLAPVNLVDKTPRTGMILRQAREQLPNQTHAIKIILQMNRKDGSYNDGFADNLELVLTQLP